MTLASKAYGHQSASHDLIEARPDGCLYYIITGAELTPTSLPAGFALTLPTGKPAKRGLRNNRSTCAEPFGTVTQCEGLKKHDEALNPSPCLSDTWRT